MWQKQFNGDLFDYECKLADNEDNILHTFWGVEYSDMSQDGGYVGNSIFSLGGNYAIATKDFTVSQMIRDNKQLANLVLFVNGKRWNIVSATAMDRRLTGQQFKSNNRFVTIFILA